MMRAKPAAVGFLCRAKSGQARELDEQRIIALARELRYELVALIEVDEASPGRAAEVIARVRKELADAVIAPGADHLGEGVPAILEAVSYLFTTNPDEVHLTRHQFRTRAGSAEA